MSMQSSFVYGYGFPCTTIEAENFISFINKHQNAINELMIIKHKQESQVEQLSSLLTFCNTYAKHLDTEIDIEDLKEIFGDIEDVCCHLFNIIALIMYIETHIHFCFEQGDAECDSPEAILLPQGYPWNFGETECKLQSEDDLKAIILPYAKELGIPENDIDYLNIEYYG